MIRRLLLLSLVAIARGAPAAAQEPAAAPVAPAAAEPVGEKPAGPSAEEVFLRDTAILQGRGAQSLELGLSYGRAERDFGVARLEQVTASADVAYRVGIGAGLQVSARVPVRHVRASAVGQGLHETRNGVGDVGLGLFGVALHERARRPNVVWSVDALVPAGAGDAGVGAGIAVTKSHDPVILFAGLSYLYGLRVDGGDPDRSLARNNLGFNLGYAFAVNESVALTGQVVGAVRSHRTPVSAARQPREQYRLELGLTYLLAPRLFAEPTVTFAIGGSAPDVAFGIAFPWSF